MFKEIENELLSIISDDPIEKIAHMPSKEIAKTMELIYNIKFENIQRVYVDKQSINNAIRMTIIYESTETKIFTDMCPINGKVYHITFIPTATLNKNEENAINLSRNIITYISGRLFLLMEEYKPLLAENNILYLTFLQVVPIITCAIMRRIYSGPTLAKVIYMSLSEKMTTYKNLYNEDGVNTILNLFDEGLGVSELLDSGFICSIPFDDPKYTGIWCSLNIKRDIS